MGMNILVRKNALNFNGHWSIHHQWSSIGSHRCCKQKQRLQGKNGKNNSRYVNYLCDEEVNKTNDCPSLKKMKSAFCTTVASCKNNRI
uniref:Uncharacterized protein n=1 Tax=Arundo donax TaxID=35708 RepID=A0A0A8ZAI8_ARUDO